MSTVLERGVHPLGVRPLGEALARGKHWEACKVRSEGLGAMSVLDDGLLLRILELLDAPSLARCSRASRMLYALGSEEDLWRRHVLSSDVSELKMEGKSWKRTYILQSIGNRNNTSTWDSPVSADGVYSDVLFHSWRCASAGIDHEWLEGDNVERHPIDTMTAEAFEQSYDKPNVPLILTGWKPKSDTDWSRKWLLSNIDKGATFNAGGFSFTLEAYFSYIDTCEDDQPLYLFDKQFAEKAPKLAADYNVPPCLGTDLFSLLGEEQHPDWRWLIIGGRRSGSSFHKDPNETSAWNGVIRGSKRWLLLPPSAPSPPGVQPSDDGGSVTAPLSPMEWFLNFFTEIRDNPALKFCTTRAGEVLFVPRGWWHTVLNLEETVAITQNFVTPSGLPHVLRFLRDKADHLSGTSMAAAKFRDIFVSALQQNSPQALQSAEASLRKRSLWTTLRKDEVPKKVGRDAREECKIPTDTEPGSFSFGFAI
mmetsp:Transcript_5293/g.15813  ORF Transcript_5293/g.15813 Transcript_5293/m.15813 type:complete len:479 (+) Transcript_5293:275-1711(+)